MKYSEKLKDPRWQKKRLQVLEKHGWQCYLCCDKDSTLHVHHQVYNGHIDPWDYCDDDLIVYCEHCHRIVHELPKISTHSVLIRLQLISPEHSIKLRDSIITYLNQPDEAIQRN